MQDPGRVDGTCTAPARYLVSASPSLRAPPSIKAERNLK